MYQKEKQFKLATISANGDKQLGGPITYEDSLNATKAAVSPNHESIIINS